MAKQTIGIGTNPNDGSGDPLRTAGTKVNDNFSEIYSALGNGATLLSGDVNFGSNNIKYQSKYLNVSALPSASAYGGMTAKVDSDNKLYFSDGTNWVKLSSGLEAFDGNYNNLTNKPSLFTGNYNDLTNRPTVPTSISDLVPDGSAGQVLTTNGAGLFTFSAINFPNQNLYQSVAGDSGSGSASTPTDTLTIAGGTNITTQMVGSTLTVNSSITALSQLTNDLTSFDGDISGSIFGDDSTLLVDGVNSKVPSANLIGALPAIDGSALVGVQATLVSGTNIKSINGESLLGSGNITVSGSGGAPAFTHIGVGADDSTIRNISEGESFKIIGGTAITTTSDAEGNITITSSGISNVVEDTTPELGGPLVTAGNRITHASAGTVSFLDFVVTQFGQNNNTVLSSVKSINLFLDSNGGDSGEAFRIYNNTNPDSSPTENTYIFKVAESGDVNVTGKVLLPDGSVSANYAGFGDDDDLKIFHNGNHSIVRETGTGNLYLQSNDNVILSKDSDTALMVKAAADGAVELYHNAVKKLETTTDGATVTGMFTSDGLTCGVQNITGPGAIDLTHTVTLLTTTGTDAYTLANGTEGQIKIISMKVNGGNGTVTPTSFVNGTNILFNNVEDTITLLYQSTGWVILARQNATVT